MTLGRSDFSPQCGKLVMDMLKSGDRTCEYKQTISEKKKHIFVDEKRTNKIKRSIFFGFKWRSLPACPTWRFTWTPMTSHRRTGGCHSMLECLPRFCMMINDYDGFPVESINWSTFWVDSSRLTRSNFFFRVDFSRSFHPSQIHLLTPFLSFIKALPVFMAIWAQARNHPEIDRTRTSPSFGILDRLT